MRLVAWNCCSGFAKKHNLLSHLQADILVISECEDINGVDFNFGDGRRYTAKRFGDHPRKGLAIFAFGNYSVEIHPEYEPEHRWVIPIRVTGPESFSLIAVWTLKDKVSGSYVRPFSEALPAYSKVLDCPNVIIAGDLNANPSLDHYERKYKFSDTLSHLHSRGIRSLYHESHSSAHGDEDQKTFYLNYSRDKGHHIDYIFGGAGIIKDKYEFEVGDYSDWIKHSDHMPLILTQQK